jgi:choline-glycine betaine transporter
MSLITAAILIAALPLLAVLLLMAWSAYFAIRDGLR